jgi:hypothetical protein
MIKEGGAIAPGGKFDPIVLFAHQIPIIISIFMEAIICVRRMGHGEEFQWNSFVKTKKEKRLW